MSKITYDEFIKRLKESTDTIIPVSEYTGWSKPIRYRCLTCGHEWDAKEARYQATKYGCLECAKKERKAHMTMLAKQRLKTEEQFRAELAEKQPNLIPNDTYKGVKTKYHCICKIHNCDVYKTPDKYIYRNQGCQLCSIESNKCATRYTHESFVEKLQSKNPNIKMLSKYKNVNSHIDVECKICGHKWSPIAESLIYENNCGCPKCAGNAIKDNDTFKEELSKTHQELKLLSPYIRSNKKVHMLCTDCNTEFWITPNKLQQGQHCPYCKLSHGEHAIRNILTNLNVSFEMQKRFDDLRGIGNKKLSYDFYLPNHNLLIEYQGEQHDRPVVFVGTTKEIAEKSFKRQMEHDRRKKRLRKISQY